MEEEVVLGAQGPQIRAAVALGELREPLDARVDFGLFFRRA